MSVQSATHASLIQGISQQSDISRGSASAEYQENCLNEVLDGAVSRMGTVFMSSFEDTLVDPFIHEVRRNENEKYILMVEDGQLRIINRAMPGAKCTITGDISAYLAQTGKARKSFQAVTNGDTTFLLNRQVPVKMGTEKTAVRPNRGCFYVRAGGYSLRYTVMIVIGGTTYTASHTTVDNSTSGNAAYITTDHIAEQFRAAMVSSIFPSIAAAGHGTFTAERIGSTVVIHAPAGKTFDLKTTDGVGDTYLKSFVDKVKSISELPAKCIEGYQVMVNRDGGKDSERFYLKFVGASDSGQWEEIPKWETVLGLDASTMPHLLVCTGLNTFEVKQASWGTRVSGDGVDTAVDPSFIGYPIRSLQFVSGRLSVISEFNMILSRARNAFVYFPDTSQTNLDTAPIDYDISNGSSTDIEFGVVAGGKLQFWGDGQQTYLDSGQDAIKESTTEVLPMANYEYDGEFPPVPSGMASLTFGTTVGRWSKTTEMFIRNGLPQGEIVTSAHVPKLLDGAIRCIAMGDGSGKAFYLTSAKSRTAYLYQWYNQGQERVQSAWNVWTLPAVSRILWMTIDGDTAYLLLQWNGVVTLESVRLDSSGDEETERLPLRLDHRVSETSATFDTDHFVLTLPYPVPQVHRAKFSCFERENIVGVSQRGKPVEFTFVDERTVHVMTSDPTRKFFFGIIPVARRQYSRFYAKDQQDQPILHEKLLIRDIYVSHKATVEYDVVVSKQDGTVTTQTYQGRVLGDTTVTNMDVPIKTGRFKAAIKTESEDVEIELVNKTPFPSTWTATKYDYDITVRN